MRFHFTRNIAGYFCISIVFAYWVYGTIVPMKVIILPYYRMGIFKLHAIVFFMFCSIMTLASLIRAAFFHPGRPPKYIGSLAQADWEDCEKCNIKRPPRAHHCRRCGHCVTRMDHHCPWINNCVGEDNHFSFMLLIFYSIALSISAFMFCITKSYRLPPCPEEICDPESWFVIHEHTLHMVSYFLSALMGLGMIGMSCGQHFAIALDVTTIESMVSKDPISLILSKPDRPLLFRYQQLCGTKNMLLWILPCRRKATLEIKDQIYNSQHIV